MDKSNQSRISSSQIANIARQKQLTLLINGSRHMLQKSEDNDWQAVAQLQDQRQNLLKRFFATAVTPQESPSVMAAVNEMLEIDKRIMELGVIARENCQEKFSNLHQHRRVAKEYATHAK